MYRMLGVVAAVFFSIPCLAAASSQPYDSAPVAVADFDGDHQIDVATEARIGDGYSGYVYQISLALSGAKQVRPIVVSPVLVARLVVAPIDLDGDRDLDLLITSQPFHTPIGVWINDGSGTFERGDINHFSDVIWPATMSLQPETLAADDDLLDTNEFQAFSCTVFPRAQIPDTTPHAFLPPEVVRPPRFYTKLAELLRGPPTLPL